MALIAGDSGVSEFLSGIGSSVQEDSLNAEDAGTATTVATNLVAMFGGIGTDAAVAAATFTGPVGFAVSAATRAAGN